MYALALLIQTHIFENIKMWSSLEKNIFSFNEKNHHIPQYIKEICFNKWKWLIGVKMVYKPMDECKQFESTVLALWILMISLTTLISFVKKM